MRNHVRSLKPILERNYQRKWLKVNSHAHDRFYYDAEKIGIYHSSNLQQK